jgi:hypothetical protein
MQTHLRSDLLISLKLFNIHHHWQTLYLLPVHTFNMKQDVAQIFNMQLQHSGKFPVYYMHIKDGWGVK